MIGRDGCDRPEQGGWHCRQAQGRQQGRPPDHRSPLRLPRRRAGRFPISGALLPSPQWQRSGSDATPGTSSPAGRAVLS